jgi:hypothetical protein
MEEFFEDASHLWGEHSLEICRFDGPVLHKGPGVSKLSTSWINSYAILVPVPDKKDAAIDMVRVFRRTEKKFRLPFTRMSDVRVIKPEEDAAVEGLFVLHYKDAQPRSIIIYLKNDEGVCRIDTTGITHLAKQLSYSWYSSNIHRSAQMKHLAAHSDPSLAAEYLREALADLQLVADKSRVAEVNLTDKQDIFEEIASESWTDLRMKESALQSRELFAATSSFCMEVCRRLHVL